MLVMLNLVLLGLRMTRNLYNVEMAGIVSSTVFLLEKQMNCVLGNIVYLFMCVGYQQQKNTQKMSYTTVPQGFELGWASSLG